MKEKVVWLKGYVPRLKPKLQYPYVKVDLPVTVRVADDGEATVVARVATASFRAEDALTFDILELDGRLWRPIHWKRAFREPDVLPAESVLARDEPDNPLAHAAKKFCRQIVDTSSPSAMDAEPEPKALAELTAEMARASERVMIIGETAYRECHEPTWVVMQARHHPSGVLLQPFVGIPGRTKDAAWFSFARLDHARVFAAEEAARLGVDVVERGSIEAMLPAPGFDDVRFAQDRVLETVMHVPRLLGGTVPGEAMDLAAEAMAAEATDRQHAVSLALRAYDALAALADRPDVAALVEATKTARAQVAYFSRNAVFSQEDESALDRISFLSP